MKKTITLILVLAGLSLNTFAQTFNTGLTLQPKTLSFGINPILYDGINNDNEEAYLLGTYIHAGYGITQGFDIGFRYGRMFEDEINHFGLDFEAVLHKSTPYISIVLGGHFRGIDEYDFGTDAQLNLTIPANRNLDFFLGLDMDYDFITYLEDGKEKDGMFRLWLPLGLEFKFLNESMAFLIEGDIALTEHAYHIFGGGFNYYFK